MRHFYQFRLGSTFGLLLISLVIALTAVDLLLGAMSNIEPTPMTKEAVVLVRNTTS